jgi:hypothetical protein
MFKENKLNTGLVSIIRIKRFTWCLRRVAAEKGEVVTVLAPNWEVQGKELEQVLRSSVDVEVVI